MNLLNVPESEFKQVLKLVEKDGSCEHHPRVYIKNGKTIYITQDGYHRVVNSRDVALIVY